MSWLTAAHLALLCLFSAGCLAAAAQEIPLRPNIALVITDDQGYGEYGCHGNPIIKTPASRKT